MLFAVSDDLSFLILIGVLGLLGECLTRSTNQMSAARRTIRGWAIGLGIVSGILSFFALSPRDNPLICGVVALCASLAWYFVVTLLVFGCTTLSRRRSVCPLGSEPA